MGDRNARRRANAAGGVWAVCITGWAVAWAASREVGAFEAATVVGGILAAPVALLLIARLPGHAVTRTLTAHTTAVLGGPAILAVAGPGWLRHAGDTLLAFDRPTIAILLVVFPYGVRDSRVWRGVLRAQLVASPFAALGMSSVDLPGVRLAGIAALILLLVTGAAAGVKHVVTWARADSDQRAAVGPFVLATAGLLGFFLLGGAIGAVLGGENTGAFAVVSRVLTISTFPIALGLGVLRHRLWGIDVVLNRLAVWTVLSFVLVTTYVLLVVGVTLATGEESPSSATTIIPAALVALALDPLRRLLQRRVDHAMYGDRGQPARALARLGRELEAARPPEDVPQLVCTAVVQSLRVPWASVELYALDADDDSTRPLASSISVGDGEVEGDGPVVHVPLTTGGVVIGRLLVPARAGERSLSPRDHEVLDAFASSAGAALLAARARAELEGSRQRLVLGREHERARLRRDLHDGLSPSLAGIALALDAAGEKLTSDPDGARRLVSRAAAEARSSHEVVRRLLDDLRPPGLAELGLAGAITQRLNQLAPPDVQVDVRSDDAGELDPTVEVAAYRIAVEAGANALRHARPRRIRVAISVSSALDLSIVDDGIGIAQDLVDGTNTAPGLGLQTMRQRASDVGGSCTITRAQPSGTSVAAHIPLVPAST